MKYRILIVGKGDETYYEVSEDYVTKMTEFYPGVDVARTFTEMQAWAFNNRLKRKTAAGMPRFMNEWFKNEQNKLGKIGASGLQRGSKITPSKWSGFEKKDYGAGVNEDGSF